MFQSQGLSPVLYSPPRTPSSLSPPTPTRLSQAWAAPVSGITAELGNCQLLLVLRRNSSTRVPTALQALGVGGVPSTRAGLPVTRNSQGCLESFKVVCFRGFAPSEAHVFQKWTPKITKNAKERRKGELSRIYEWTRIRLSKRHDVQGH